MPERETTPAGSPCWIDLYTSDPDKSRRFYSELLGWTSEDAGEEYGGYINFRKDGIAVAGAMKNDGAMGIPDTWTVYMAVDDAEATADAAAAHGGQVTIPAMDMMDLGRMAMLSDAGGAAIGVWQPGLHKGFGVIGETGAPVHFELHARDYDGSLAFYRDVFGWDTREMGDTAEVRYSLVGDTDGQQCGIMDASGFLPEGVPAHWEIYFGVDDVDKALAQIEQTGGSTITPGEDTPYGRLAAAVDPTGAAFRLRSEV